jgi:uncharacterized membrane protein YphA (DoxX/SURF4 family)
MSNHQSETLSPTPNAVHMVRLSLGLIYFHFGFLKFYPDLSPAEIIASYTAERMSLHWLDSATALQWIAILECVIGLCFLFNVFLAWVAPLFFFHMAATFAPILLLPEFAFKFAPLAPTIEGQYILKNLVLVSAGWIVLAPHMGHYRKFFHKLFRPRDPITPKPIVHQ